MKHVLSYVLILLLVLGSICPGQALSSIDREQEIREAVTAFVIARTTGMGWEVHIRRLTISDVLKLPEGNIEYDVIAPQQWEGWGNVSIAVLARQKDRVLRNIPVRVEAEAFVDTVVALRLIEQGASITAADLVLQKREITQNTSRASRKIEEIAGKRARTTIKANQTVRTDQVEKVPLVKSGQMVTIIAENDVIKISVAGKARSSGAVGDVVIVQNQNSLKEIPARVINSTTVQIAF
ncbi:MAG: flagellar basal body P-ring formation chaperone FlgA [Desulfuromonadales bacterium]